MFHSDEQRSLNLNPVTYLQPKDLRAPAALGLRRGFTLGWLRVILLFLLDCGLLIVAWQAAQFLSHQYSFPWDLPERFKLLPRTAILVPIFMFLAGLYRCGQQWYNSLKLVKTVTLVHLLTMFIAWFDQPGIVMLQSTRVWLWLTSVILLTGGRMALGAATKNIRRNGVVCYPVFVFCQPAESSTIIRSLSSEGQYSVLGWNDISLLDSANCRSTVDRMQRLGVAEVFICAPLPAKYLMFLYWSLRNAGITLHISTLVYANNALHASGNTGPTITLQSYSYQPPLITGFDFSIKRILDFLAACMFIGATAPVYLLIAALIKLDSPGPVFFRQTRIGLHGKEFKVWKFRTMVINAAALQAELEALNETSDGVLFKIKRDPRITRIGGFLRRYSLDELPQIFNVLLGEMSFVGPRPLPVRDVERFSQDHFLRHEVLPGITGLWQVSGRSDITDFEDVISLDLFYIQTWSLRLDMKIILRTAQAVLGKSGAY
ncbi:sugar transferase [filamentous cyanobacterium LEGE 11480]|uniref:Sugar transferase n=1 Tax=Romeriopsis navalis LEGE 11480 TaxID=2777977 RepID=A0A928Z2Y7_9CYAN|nr:sugar transferase [Romeriopsis navalis]MBE9028805.1 sugar transferase [Romeriopsis navalis LEGE 11480]